MWKYFCILEFFIDPAQKLNYKERKDFEKIQRVNMIRPDFKANYRSLDITRNILYFNCAKSH